PPHGSLSATGEAFPTHVPRRCCLSVLEGVRDLVPNPGTARGRRRRRSALARRTEAARPTRDAARTRESGRPDRSADRRALGRGGSAHREALVAELRLPAAHIDRARRA